MPLSSQTRDVQTHCYMLRHPTFSSFDTIPACDRRTDRQTDGRTHDDSIYCASIESHGKNAGECHVKKTVCFRHFHNWALFIFFNPASSKILSRIRMPIYCFSVYTDSFDPGLLVLTSFRSIVIFCCFVSRRGSYSVVSRQLCPPPYHIVYYK